MMTVSIVSREVTATVSGDYESTDEVLRNLIIPALLGAGFHPDNVWETIADFGAEWERSRNADAP